MCLLTLVKYNTTSDKCNFHMQWVFLRLSVAAHALLYLVRSLNRVIKHLKVRKRRANVFHVNSWINFRRQLQQTFCLATHVETSTQFV